MKAARKHTSSIRLANRFAVFAMKIGIAPKYQYLLSVQGRKSGKTYSTPVYIIEENGKKWLVSPYGEVAWVRNARVMGRISLTKGNESEGFQISEVSAEESAPILKKYLALAPITQPYFDAKPNSPEEFFRREASRHPVFALQGLGKQVQPIAPNFSV
jgi:deazaflavin-dependent oxidoreductase (nitroreductase family)